MAKSKPRKRRIILIIAGSLLIILIAARIALPYILLRFVNKELTKIKGYTGHVQDIDVALIRGAYTIKGIQLEKKEGKVPVPFFSANAIDLSVEWRALFHGALVGKIIAYHPMLNFVNGPTASTSQTKIGKSWTQVVSDLMPLKLNRFEIMNGEIHYRDYYSTPKVNIYTKNIHIVAENLSNAKHQKKLLPSTVTATADVYGGTAKLSMQLNALADTPTFDASAELVSLDITNLNNFLEAYGSLDVDKGSISIYTEAAAKDGYIKGYTKPIIKDLKVVNWQKDKDKPLHLVWEEIVGAATWVFKNHKKDQLATKADFEGKINDPNVNIWYIIGELLRNAFIQALYPSLENSININSVGPNKQPPTKLSKAYQKTQQSSPAKKKQ